MLAVVGLYAYLAMRTGKPAEARAMFARGLPKPLVFAHRGGGGLYPENTLDAFRHSAEIGADVLELDVHRTADGALVVIHDSTVDRTTDGNGKVSELTLAEIRNLDAAFRFSNDGGQNFPLRGKGVRIPTLQEIFDAFPGKKFNIEPKAADPVMVATLCNEIRDRGKADRVIVGSFRQAAIEEFRTACPEVATSATPSEVTEFLALFKLGIGETYSPPMQVLQIPEKVGALQIVSPEFVETARRLNLQIHVWTINRPEDMQRLIDTGVDGIMTDYPDKLLSLVNRR